MTNGSIFCQNGVVDIMEKVARECCYGLIVDSNGISSGIPRSGEVDVHENVSFQMSVAIVQVEALVGRSMEDIIVGCEYWSRALSS